MTCSLQTQEMIRIAAEAAIDKLATHPVAIDVSERLHFAEAFLVTSAPTERQVRAIAENVMDRIAEEHGVRPDRIEGRSDAHWILLDYSDVVVHVLVEEDREYYALEKVWGDRPLLDLAELASPAEQAGGVAV